MASRSLLLRALILLGMISAGFVIAWERGALALILGSDSSYLSALILALYAAASVHWVVMCARLSRDIDALAGEPAPSNHPAAVLLSGSVADPSVRLTLLRTVEDEVMNRHAPGHFIVDALLKLGLLGTIVGFVLMLLPIGELRDFDTAAMQRMLSSMSGGMGVSLYTTLAGLVTHLLLRLQYFVLDAAAAGMINGLSRRVLAH